MSWAWVVCDFNLLTITCVCGWSREREGKKKEIGREGGREGGAGDWKASGVLG